MCAMIKTANTVFCLLIASLLLLSVPEQAAAQKEQMFPLTFYRTGPYAPGGSGAVVGLEDYLALTNLRGGVEGVMLK